MATPIVHQLQELASDNSHEVTELLRKALIVASKLRQDQFRDWVRLELEGYPNSKEVPKYRILRSDLRVENPYHGLIPFLIPNEDFHNAITEVRMQESISSVHQLLHSTRGDRVVVYFSPDQEQLLMRLQGSIGQMRPIRVFGKNQLMAVINAVRTKVLEWALALEAEGIVGDGLSFSDKERDTAMKSKSIQIQNFQGVLGDVHGGSVSQTNTMSIAPGDFPSLARHLQSHGLKPEALDELQLAIQQDPNPPRTGRFGPAVSGWMGKMVGYAATGTWEVGVNVAGALLAEAITKFYS